MEQERKRILNMVQEGKLTVDEALVLLDELGKSSESMKKKEEQLYGELSTMVKSEGAKFEEAKKEDGSSSYKFQSAKEKLFEFVDTTIKKIKDLDLDLNFGHSVDISHIFQHAEASISSIDIDMANGSAKLIPWDQDDVRVECDVKVYRVDTPEEARNIFLNDVVFAIENDKLKFFSQQKWMKLNAKIYIPQTQYENIKVRMFNGSIESENLAVTKYNAKTANGKINLTGMSSKYVEVETANGQIDLRNSQIEDFEAETINGAIKVDGKFKRVDLQSFNGSITFSLAGESSCEIIEAKSTTGGIKLYLPETLAIRGEFKSNLGAFQVDREGITTTEEKSEVVQKLLRFEPLNETFHVAKMAAETKTGSITMKRVK